MRLRNLLVLALPLLFSCVSVPDIKLCTEIEPTMGYCTTVLTNQESQVTGGDWAVLKLQSIIMPVDSWVQLKDFIQNLCHQNKQYCTNGVGNWNGIVQGPK